MDARTGGARSAVWVSLATVVVIAGAIAWWAPWSTRAEPPLPADLEGVDAEVVALIQETRDDVVADPGDPDGWATLGMVYEANGLIGVARDCYTEAVAMLDSNAGWWYRLAVVEARLGDLEAALASIARTTDLVDGYAPAHWRKGLWLFDGGDIAGAEAAFRHATEVDADDVGGWVGLARVFLVRQQPEQAVEALEGLLDRRPGERYALQLLGRAYRQQGRVEDARIAMAMGAGGEPILRDAWSERLAQYQRGYATLLKAAAQYRVAGQLDAAIATYEKLRLQRPDDLALLNRLATTYLVAGRHDEGLALLEDALGRDPDHVETQVNLASGFLRTGDATRALDHAGRALELSPRSGRAHEARAMILWRTDRREAAIAAFRDALRYDPRNQMAWVWTGMIQAELGRPEEALASFQTAVAKAPTLTEAWLGIAKVTMTLGRLDEAEVALRRAMQLDGATPQVDAGLAELRALRGALGDEGAAGQAGSVPP